MLLHSARPPLLDVSLKSLQSFISLHALKEGIVDEAEWLPMRLPSEREKEGHPWVSRVSHLRIASLLDSNHTVSLFLMSPSIVSRDCLKTCKLSP
jgi:hypothetical protein